VALAMKQNEQNFVASRQIQGVSALHFLLRLVIFFGNPTLFPADGAAALDISLHCIHEEITNVLNMRTVSYHSFQVFIFII
jgi:hypothetical protein